MLKEFKEFAVKGNVIDLAVGIVIGVAFGAIITSFVNDIMMPLISLLFGKADFTNMFITLSGPEMPTLEAAKQAGALTLNYGLFINSIMSFLIIAFSIFLVIRYINKLKREKPASEDDTVIKECSYCYMDIPVNASRCPHCTSQLDITKV